MPITATLGALSYSRSIGNAIAGNAWVAVQNAVNNIQPGSVLTLISSSADIEVNSSDRLTFGYAADTWKAGYVATLSGNGATYNGMSGSLTGSNTAGLAAGATDSSDNLYGCGITTAVVGANFDKRIYVAKRDSSNSMVWQNHYYLDPSTSNADWANGIKLSPDGNIYVVGCLDTVAFLMKLDTSGTIQWTRSLSGGGQTYITGFDFDSSNNIYVVGKGTTEYFITKFDNSGTTLINYKFNSGIPSGVHVKGSNVYVAIDTGFIKFDTSLNIIDQYQLGSIGGSNTGLESWSTAARKITVDSSDNIYIVFPRVISGQHYLYLAGIDSSYNLLYCNRIQTSIPNNFNTKQTSPTASGIKVNSNRIYIVFRMLSSGTNYMWACKLPSDGSIPTTGTYKITGVNQVLFYNKAFPTISTSSYTLGAATNSPATANLTTASTTFASAGVGGWTDKVNI